MSNDNVIGIEIDSNAKEVLAQIHRMPKEMTARVAAAVNLVNQATIRRVITDYISFPSNGPTLPDALRRQSGTLARSLRATPAIVEGDLTISTSIGTNVIYGRVHEFGMNMVVSVRAYYRRQFSYKNYWKKDYLDPVTKLRKYVLRETRTDKKDDVLVRPHTREMNMPARHWLSVPIQNNDEMYGDAISRAIVNTWNESAIESNGALKFIGSYSV